MTPRYRQQRGPFDSVGASASGRHSTPARVRVRPGFAAWIAQRGLEAGAAVCERLQVYGQYDQVALAFDEIATMQVRAQPRRQLTRRRRAVRFDALDDGQRGRGPTADHDLDRVRQPV